MALKIADVSEFQRIIDWAAYGAQNPAVIVRVHNSSRADNYAKANIAGARKNCKWRGWYQYLNAGADPVKAAHDFQATLGPTLPGEVMILDLEEGSGDQRGRRAAWLEALQDPVEWVYSGLYFARVHLTGVKVEWLAAYGQGEPTDGHTLWQYTNAQRFAGIVSPCDGNTFNGTLAQLQALSKSTIITPEIDMPVTSAEMDQIATRTSRELLGTLLGSSGPTVGIALQHASGLVNVDPAKFAAAVVAAMPPEVVTGTTAVDPVVLKSVVEEAVREVFVDAGTP